MSTKNVFGALAITLGALTGLPACALDDGAGDVAEIEQDALTPITLTSVVVVGPTTETLNYTTPVGVTASKYVIYRGLAPGGATSFTSAGPSPFTYGHLSPNTNYCWQVAYVSGGVASPRSNEICASTANAPVPGVPANVVATATSSDRIVVSWDSVAGATAYQVFQGIPPGAPTFLATVLAPTTTFRSAGLTPATTYSYEIRAITAAGTSAASTPLAAATTFVLGLEAYYKFDERAGTTTADFAGQARNGTLNGAAAFTNDKPHVLDDIAVISVPATTASNVTVPNVPAFNFTGPFSLLTWVKLPVATDVHIIGMRSAGCGALGWELGQNTTSGLYFASRTGTQSFGGSLAAGSWTHVAVTWDDVTLTMYLNGVQVQSVPFSVSNPLRLPLTMGHVGGCPGGAVLLDETQIYSRVLTPAQVAKLGALPPAPVNLNVTVVSSTRMDLTWDAVPGVTKYFIYRGTGAGDETFFTSSSAASPPTFVYGHLAPDTQYSWSVAAAVPPLFSNPTTAVVARTFPAPTAPVATATTVSSSRIRIDWNSVARATSYRIYVSTTGGAPFSFLGTVLSPAVTFTAAGLSSMTTYSFQVQAFDAGLTPSAFSATVSATTL
jgi:hypothetical protein